MPAAPPTSPPTARRLSLEAALVGVAAFVASLPVLQYWQQPLGVPLDYEQDATFYLMLARSMKEHGWYLTNPELGAPYGQEMHDLALGGDNLNFLVQRVLLWFAEPATAVNVFFVLTIVTVAAVAHVVLRLLGVRRSVAAVIAIVYTFLPYHMVRRTPHVMLSSYALVPVAVLLALWVMSSSPPIVGDRTGWWPGLRREPRTWWVLGACVGLASTGSYYAVFAAFLLAVAGISAALARRSWRPLRSAGIGAAVIAAVTVLNTAPSILYWARHGTNLRVAHRLVQESEMYGLRIQQLFMPRMEHRNASAAEFAYRAWAGPVRSEPGQQLGIIAACGLAGLLVVAAVGLVRRPSSSETADDTRRVVLERLGLLAIASMLTGTLSGFSYLLALGGLKQIRGWNRISVMLGFIALVAVAFAVEAMVEVVRRRRGHRPAVIATVVILAGLTGVAWYDQTSPVDTAVRAGVREAWESDAAFFGGMADALATGTAVFELPDMTFPEGGAIGRIGLYDGARGYVHAPSLRWSFGGMLGRVPEWPKELETQPPELTVATLRAAGFGALFVDRLGYPDNGDALVARLSSVLTPRGTSPDGRYVWFDLGADDGA